MIGKKLVFGVVSLTLFLTGCGQPNASPGRKAELFDVVRERIAQLVVDGEVPSMAVAVRRTTAAAPSA